MRAPILLTALLFAAPLVAACQPSTGEAPAAEASAEADDGLMMPADAPPQEDVIAPDVASSTSCLLDQGADASAALVRLCIAVSPATHPPCNAANPCRMIQDEIDRSCAQFSDADRPAECAA